MLTGPLYAPCRTIGTTQHASSLSRKEVGVAAPTKWNGLAMARAARVYAAPGRVIDLSGLPPAFIDVGSIEIFRDNDVPYISQLLCTSTITSRL
jgi:acetyl esterase/lipase